MGQQRLTLAPPSLLLPDPPSCKHPSLTDVPELSDFGAEAEAEGGLLPETVSTLGPLAVHWEDFQGPVLPVALHLSPPSPASIFSFKKQGQPPQLIRRPIAKPYTAGGAVRPLINLNKRPLFSRDFLCLEPLSKAERPSVHGGSAGVLSGTPLRAGGHFEHCCSQTRPFLLKKAQQAPGNERKALNLLTFLERGSYLPTSGPEHWVGAGRWVAQGSPTVR